MRTLLCEGGGEIKGGLFRTGLVDSLYVTIAPFVFGGRNAPTLADGHGIQEIKEATHLRLTRLERRGQELFLVYDAVMAR